jgi:hypothetical protein
MLEILSKFCRCLSTCFKENKDIKSYYKLQHNINYTDDGKRALKLYDKSILNLCNCLNMESDDRKEIDLFSTEYMGR